MSNLHCNPETSGPTFYAASASLCSSPPRWAAAAGKSLLRLCAVWLGLLLVFAGRETRAAEADRAPDDSRLAFSAMGDVPYIFYEEYLLGLHVRGLPKSSLFAVHVGDIKRGAVPCEADHYRKVADILAQSSLPLFIIPGDNEWNDCPDPDRAWQHWRTHFLHFDQRFEYAWEVVRAPAREENFAFVLRRVLFVGINLMGGRLHDADEWARRHRDNLAWIERQLDVHQAEVTHFVLFGHAHPTAKHDDFLQPLLARLQKFDKPTLYVHGDGHTWIHDQPWRARNVWRVQVDRGGIAPPIQVHVSESAEAPFVILRRPDKAGDGE